MNVYIYKYTEKKSYSLCAFVETLIYTLLQSRQLHIQRFLQKSDIIGGDETAQRLAKSASSWASFVTHTKGL